MKLGESRRGLMVAAIAEKQELEWLSCGAAGV